MSATIVKTHNYFPVWIKKYLQNKNNKKWRRNEMLSIIQKLEFLFRRTTFVFYKITLCLTTNVVCFQLESPNATEWRCLLDFDYLTMCFWEPFGDLHFVRTTFCYFESFKWVRWALTRTLQLLQCSGFGISVSNYRWTCIKIRPDQIRGGTHIVQHFYFTFIF